LYKFDPSKLPDAHQWAQQNFAQRASKGVSPLIVDNTNIATWEMYPYLQMASQYSYLVEIMEPATPWKSNARALSSKNQHGVPEEKIRKMKDNFEPGTVEVLMRNLNLSVVREPQMRNHPPLERVEKLQEVPQVPTSNLIDFTGKLSVFE
jgi:NEDD4-binding protein 2